MTSAIFLCLFSTASSVAFPSTSFFLCISSSSPHAVPEHRVVLYVLVISSPPLLANPHHAGLLFHPIDPLAPILYTSYYYPRMSMSSPFLFTPPLSLVHFSSIFPLSFQPSLPLPALHSHHECGKIYTPNITNSQSDTFVIQYPDLSRKYLLS